MAVNAAQVIMFRTASAQFHIDILMADCTGTALGHCREFHIQGIMCRMTPGTILIGHIRSMRYMTILAFRDLLMDCMAERASQGCMFRAALLKCITHCFMAEGTGSTGNIIRVIDFLRQMCRMAVQTILIPQLRAVGCMTVDTCLDLSVGRMAVQTLQFVMPARIIGEFFDLGWVAAGT